MSIRPSTQYFIRRPSTWIAWQPMHLRPQSLFIPIAKFHASPSRGDDVPANPYEVLGVPASASQADIKKQFFKLSKLYHPDHNPNDQKGAAAKFTALSDAYHIIGNQAKREKFDRDNQRSSGQRPAGETRGSYGSRSPSGLSRRRGAFRGPPPSFYRNGGFGSSTRRNTESSSTGAGATEGQPDHQGASGPGGPYGGTTGDWPFKTDPNDVPHFNREGHYRTTTSIEEQLRKGRDQRRDEHRRHIDQMLEEDSPGNIAGRFLHGCGHVSSWYRRTITNLRAFHVLDPASSVECL